MRNHPARLLIGTLCVAAVIAAMPSANAASKFDGMWSAVFRTKSGPCQPAYRGAVASGQRDHSGRQHRRFPLWSRFAQWLGESHRVHGRELRRRIGTSFGQFRQRNLARSHGKRELCRRLDCAATIIAPANRAGLGPQVSFKGSL